MQYSFLALFVFLLAPLWSSTPAQANWNAFDSIRLTYELVLDSERIGTATLGQIETTLTRENGLYKVNTLTKAQGLAAILVGDFSETCTFDIAENRAVSRSYQGGRPDRLQYSVGFDWRERKIRFNQQKTLDMPTGYLVDNCNMPFALAHTSIPDKKDTIYIIDGKKERIRGYRLKERTPEVINTKLGRFTTERITLERTLEPDKTLTLWLSKEHHSLPIKLRESRKERVTTMMLTDYLTQEQ